MPFPPHGIVGRDGELAVLRGFLDRIEELPAAVVLEGEAGAGKTTLLGEAARLASDRGYRVLRCAPTPTERELTFAGLRDLVEPVLEEVRGALPEPQARALDSVMLRSGAPRLDPGAVARAVLEGLRALAAERPLLLSIDDAPWLDAESLRVLAYSLRRLRRARVALILARRTGPDERLTPLIGALPGPLRALEIGPLSLGALHLLLLARTGTAFARPTLRWIHETSRGNPLMAVEIARALPSPAPIIGPGGGPPPVPPSLRALLEGRLAALTGGTREVLACAAEMGHPTLSALASALGRSVDAEIDEAERASIVSLRGDRVTFAHPLFAAAASEHLSTLQRRRLHARLAEIESDPERRARHLAAAAAGPDGSVARALDEAAAAAAARGAPAAAAELAERARDLTCGEGPASERRHLDAARYRFLAGDTPGARALLEEALPRLPPGELRAEALAALGRLHLFTDDLDAAADLLSAAARERGAPDALRAEAEEGLAWALVLGPGGVRSAVRHASRAALLAERAGDRRLALEALAMRGLAEYLRARRSGRDLVERSAREAAVLGYPRVLRSPEWALAVVDLWGARLGAARAALDRLRDAARMRGDESSLPRILLALSLVEMHRGDWAAAGELAAEAEEIAAQEGQRAQVGLLMFSKAVVDAHRGDQRAVLEAARGLPSPGGPDPARMIGGLSLGLLALSRGDFEEADRALAPLVAQMEAAGITHPGARRFVPDEVEALVGLGHLERARTLLEPFRRSAARLGHRSALAAALRSDALLSTAEGDRDRALASLRRALRLDPAPFDRARVLLALGTVYRRVRKSGQARAVLEEAVETFERLGASLWVARARDEAARIPGRRRSGGLTPTERRVAELVAEGRTNREIAAATFVTIKAVEATLGRIYAKLGVRSRTELVRHLLAGSAGGRGTVGFSP